MPADVESLGALLPTAVERARAHFVERRGRFEDEVNAKLEEELRELERLKTRRLERLRRAVDRSAQTELFKRAREEKGKREIDRIFDDYLEWVQDTMTTEREPWIKVICVMTGAGTAGN